jgi:hypothetical protein
LRLAKAKNGCGSTPFRIRTFLYQCFIAPRAHVKGGIKYDILRWRFLAGATTTAAVFGLGKTIEFMPSAWQ